jgi:hypothetical protein
MKKIFRIGLALLATVAVAVGYAALMGPSSTEIRMDCGDVRYRYFGMPMIFTRQNPESRLILLSLARKSPFLRPVWLPVVRQTSSNNPLAAYQNWYVGASIWCSVDADVGRLLVEDIASAIRDAKGVKIGVPKGIYLLRLTYETDLIPTNWMFDPKVRAYCKARGYSRPEWEAIENTTLGFASEHSGSAESATRKGLSE